MNKLVRFIRRWRYRRLYSRLFLLYAGKLDFAECAAAEASAAFFLIYGFEYDEL